MKIPPIKPDAFYGASTMFQQQPKALLEIDAPFYWHCQRIAARSPDPFLANNVLTLAHHTLFMACKRQNIVPPPSRDDVFHAVTSEMISLEWDTNIVRRLESESDYRTYQTVFEDMAKKKEHPMIVRQNARRIFRIFELL